MTIWTVLAAIWVIGVLVYLNRLRKHPSAENDAREASFIARIKCGIVVYGLVVAVLLGLGILLAKLTQNTALFYDAPMALVRSPAFTLVVGIFSWFAAPMLMRQMPASAFAEPAGDEAAQPKARTLPAEITTTDPGVINLDPEAFEHTDDSARGPGARDSRAS